MLKSVLVYLTCFAGSLYALSAVKFDTFMDIRRPVKVHILLLLLSMGLAYISGSYLLILFSRF